LLFSLHCQPDARFRLGGIEREYNVAFGATEFIGASISASVTQCHRDPRPWGFHRLEGSIFPVLFKAPFNDNDGQLLFLGAEPLLIAAQVRKVDTQPGMLFSRPIGLLLDQFYLRLSSGSVPTFTLRVPVKTITGIRISGAIVALVWYWFLTQSR
jgi:hypothetical protein